MFYPAEWPSIVRELRRRSGGRCELCGVPDGLRVRRLRAEPYVWRAAEDVSVLEASAWREPIRVVLSAAHRDHRLVDHSLGNLLDLCQRCHILHDQGFSGKIDPRPVAFQLRGGGSPPRGG